MIADDPDECPNIVYKICLMPHHTTEQIDTFIDDLVKAEVYWQQKN
jgi:hypothetical protein